MRKMRKAHGRTWYMARNTEKGGGNEKNTLKDLEYGNKH